MLQSVKTLLLASLLLIYGHPVLWAESELHLLEATIKQLRPFTCHFTQEYYDAFQEKTATAAGIFSFRQPGLMKWVYEAPETIIFIVGKEQAWLYDPDLENVTIQNLANVSGIQSLRFLSGAENISDHFKLTKPKNDLLDSSVGKKAVFLTPVRQNQALAELQVAFDPASKRIFQFVLIDHNRNYRKLTLTDIKNNPGLKESDFEFAVTEEMEIIQGFDN